MKTVFSCNQELCHVWTKQDRDNGRANNMFFQKDIIYSYGPHYKAAKLYSLHNHPNYVSGAMVLINSKNYSSSTSKHLSHIRRATSHLKTFIVPLVDVSSKMDHEVNLKFLESKIIDYLDGIFSCKKHYMRDWLKDLEKDYNEYIRLFEIKWAKKIEWNDEMLNYLFEHQVWTVSRNSEVERIRKERDGALSKLFDIELEKYRASNKIECDIVGSWVRGESNMLSKYVDFEVIYKGKVIKESRNVSRGADYHIIRVRNGDTVETSGHVRVSLFKAVLAMKAIMRGDDLEAIDFDGFKGLKRYKGINGEDIVQVGCHHFDFNQCLDVLKPYL